MPDPVAAMVRIQLLTGCRTEEDLPPAAREYISFISDYVGVPINLVGVGPARDEVVWIQS